MSAIADWSLPLVQPVTVDRKTLRTIGDLRDFVLALPDEARETDRWHKVAGALLEAAETGNAEHGRVAFLLVKFLERM